MSGKYKNPALTVDITVFSIIDKSLNLLLIKRKNPPFQDKWAIPGGFVDYGEDIPNAAIRELEEETGLKNIPLRQAHTFGAPGRDPRGRTVSVVYFSLINSTGLKIKADTDAKAVEWFNIYDLPELAFDHKKIIDFAILFLRQKIENTTITKDVLPKEFTMQEIQEIYEIILNNKFSKEFFQQKINETGFLQKTENAKYKFKKEIDFVSKFLC